LIQFFAWIVICGVVILMQDAPHQQRALDAAKKGMRLGGELVDAFHVAIVSPR
jgi:hypothetical protein